MKSLKFIFAMIVSVAFMVGCAGPKSFVDNTWSERPQNVKVVFTEPAIGNPDDLADDLPEFKDNFSDWYKATWTANLDKASHQKVAFTMEKVDASAISAETVKLGDKDFEAPKFAEMGSDADVYLVINNAWVGRENEETQTVQGNLASESQQTVPGSGVSISNYFKAKCTYAFYDVKANKIVAYGAVEGKAQYQFAVSKGDWEFAVGDLVDKVVAKTPILPW